MLWTVLFTVKIYIVLNIFKISTVIFLHKYLRNLRFQRVFVSSDQLIVFELCPFEKEVLETAVFECDFVCLIWNNYLLVENQYLGYGRLLLCFG